MDRIVLKNLVAVVLLAALLGCAARTHVPSRPAPETLAKAQDVTDKADQALADLLGRDEQGVFADLLAKAQGVMVFPELVNVGFFLAIGGGSGVAMARQGEQWSGPFFVTMRQGGYGVQAGLEKMTGVLLIMDRAVFEDVLENGSALRGQASATLLDATWLTRTPRFEPGGDVVFLSDGVGAFAGVAISGTDVGHRDTLNAAWWAGATDWREVLFGGRQAPAGAASLLGRLEQSANKKANP